MSASVLAGGAYSQTLSRGLCLLESLARAGTPLTLGELCAEIGIHRSVGYRLIRTLAEHNLVQPVEHDRYVLGVGLLSLARGVEPDLRAEVRSILQDLSTQVEATATLCVEDRGDVVCLVSVEPSSSMLRVSYREGLRHPLSQGAAGIALLAAGPARRGEIPAVQRARRLGFATSEQELEPDTRAVSVPVIVRGRGCLAVVSVVSVASRLTDVSAVAQAAMLAAGRVADVLANEDTLGGLFDRHALR